MFPTFETRVIVQLEIGGRTFALGVDRREMKSDEQFINAVDFLCHSLKHTVFLAERNQLPAKDTSISIEEIEKLNGPGFIPEKKLS